METHTLRLPDDWHVHLRDGAALATTVPHSAAQFGRVLVMPNLVPPIARVADALDYRKRILQFAPSSSAFNPLMALYLTDNTSVEEVRRAAEEPSVLGFKLYPAGTTTHSEAGVTSLQRIYPLLEAMERFDVPLMVHGEVAQSDVDIFDREKSYIESELEPMIRQFPALRISLEHITTSDAVQFVESAADTVAATITAHHLLFNRNALLTGGLKPHYYCLPVLKREPHRLALLTAAGSDSAKFFLGTDSAPHPRDRKESACGCAGCYTAHAALELYAMAFEAKGILDRLEQFASVNGSRFYKLPVNEKTVTLEKAPWTLPDQFALGTATVIPLKAGESIPWRIQKSPQHS